MKKIIATTLISALTALSAPLSFAEQGSTPGVSAVATSANESTGGVAPSQAALGSLGGVSLATILTFAVIAAAVVEASDGDDSTSGTTN